MFDDLEKVKQGLSCHAHIAHMCAECPYNEQRTLYMKGTGSPCDSFLADDAIRLLEKAVSRLAANMAPSQIKSRPRLLTLEEITRLNTGALVWLEESGGYDGTRYGAKPVIVFTVANKTAVFYGGSGRAFEKYNMRLCGWRLWTAEPPDKLRLETKRIAC